MEYLVILTPTHALYKNIIEKPIIVSCNSLLNLKNTFNYTLEDILKGDHLMEDLEGTFVWYFEVDYMGKLYPKEERGIHKYRYKNIAGFRILKPYFLI